MSRVAFLGMILLIILGGLVLPFFRRAQKAFPETRQKRGKKEKAAEAALRIC
jgi:hypothetical protein